MSHQKYKHVGSPAIRLIEECAELIKAVCKAERFGWDNFHPDDSPDKTNTHYILKEIDDVEEAIVNMRLFIRGSAAAKAANEQGEG